MDREWVGAVRARIENEGSGADRHRDPSVDPRHRCPMERPLWRWWRRENGRSHPGEVDV